MFLQKWNSVRAATIAVVLFTGCTGGDDSTDQISKYVPDTIEESGFYGWESVTVKNAFVQLDVVPELGGRIMGYSLLGEQLLWHHPTHEGEIGPFTSADRSGGPINIGGATVLAVQNDDSNHTHRLQEYTPYSVEKNGVTVTVSGPTDNRTGGTDMHFEHRYTLASRSTEVGLELSMTNRGTDRTSAALSQFITLPADTSTTFFVPVSHDNDWEVTLGDSESTQWLGIEDGVFQARFNGSEGKVSLQVSDGWAAWYDAERSIANVIRFPLGDGAEYPENGHQVEIYSSGDVIGETGAVQSDLATMALGIRGPLNDLAQDERTSMDITWSSCRCSGIEELTDVGIVSEKPRFYSEYHILTASFGFFSSGTLFEHYYDEAGEKTSRIRIMPVNPQSEVDIRREIFVPLNTVGIRYELWSEDDTLLGVIADVKLPEEVIRRPDNQ